MNEGRRSRHPGTSSPPNSSKDPLLRRMISITIFVNANICQPKFLPAIPLPESGRFGYSCGAQLLHHVGAQGLVQTYGFVSLSAQPGWRADGRAVLAAHRA